MWRENTCSTTVLLMIVCVHTLQFCFPTHSACTVFKAEGLVHDVLCWNDPPEDDSQLPRGVPVSS